MTALAEAAKGCPFSNGTEGADWMAKWCDHCAHDHTSHIGEYEGGGCPIVVWMYGAERNDPYPECLVPHPPKMWGWMVCTRYEPCAPCGGDPAPTERAERVATVERIWREVVSS